MSKEIYRTSIMFLIFGVLYLLIELLWRGTSHPAMILVGGVSGALIGLINEHLPWEMSIIKQGIIGAVIVTCIEFISGCILNLWLGLGIWDYSNMPLNVCGQICLPFSIAWFFLSLVAIVLDDVIRWRLFGEEKPHYHLRDRSVNHN